MKIILTALLVLGSLSSFAESEFERGYNAGLNAKDSKNVKLISLTFDYARENHNNKNMIATYKLEQICEGGKVSEVSCSRSKGVAMSFYETFCAALCIRE